MKVLNLIMSNLSDAQFLMGANAESTVKANKQINFAKYLMILFENTNTELTKAQLEDIEHNFNLNR